MMLSPTHTRRRCSLAALALSAVCGAFAAPAAAQTGAELMLKPFPKEQAVDASADGYFYNGGHERGQTSAAGGDVDFRLGIYESAGRFRLQPGELASPRIGYSFTWFELHGSDRRLPDQLVDQSIGFATPIAKYDDWIVGLSVGVGYAGTTPFGDGDAWYGKASLAAFKQLDDHTALAFVLDYNGNRTFLPDAPLPGVAYIKRIDPTLLLTIGVPVTSVEWKPTPQLQLELSYTLVENVSGRIGYEFLPGWTAYALAAQRTDAFYADHLPHNFDRILFEQRRAEVGVTWHPCKEADLTAAVGYAWGGEFSTGFDLRNADELAKISDEPYVRVGFQVRF